MTGQPRLRSDRTDTIFALASGAGRAAVAVIRVSGPRATDVLAAMAPGRSLTPRRASLRHLRDPATGETLDDALTLWFPAPASFTGEAMAELQVTGGRAVARGILEALAGMAGLRVAEPGEFAWRAFLNGKLDLSAVEGLADLVDAETSAQRRQALRLAGGALQALAEAIRADLLEAGALLEALIDFSDVEDADALSLAQAREVIRRAEAKLRSALSGAAAARIVREGFHVVVAGPPNAGKSSLVNALARRDVAIVSPFAGTTRDVIETFLEIDGLPVILVDTAGLRETSDLIEREGVRRAEARMQAADLTLRLTAPNSTKQEMAGVGVAAESGAGAALNPPSESFSRRGAFGGTPISGPTVAGGVDQAAQWAPDGPAVLEVFTKADLIDIARLPGALYVSAETGEGLDALTAAIVAIARTNADGGDSLIAHERHRAAFAEALNCLERALDSGQGEAELIAEDLRLASRALQRIAGRIDVEDVLDQIFARLCVGK